MPKNAVRGSGSMKFYKMGICAKNDVGLLPSTEGFLHRFIRMGQNNLLQMTNTADLLMRWKTQEHR